MSRMVVLTRKSLVPGFQLGGVYALGVVNAREAQMVISPWLEDDETVLLAIDHDIYQSMDEAFCRRLKTNEHIFLVTIPGSQFLKQSDFHQQQVTRMIQQAVGVHITFKGQKNE